VSEPELPAEAPPRGAILLVRHGETESNAARILQWPDTPLSARGIGQAERLARRLARLPIGRIVSSDYARARMTGECVARATGAPLELDPGLRERNFGDLRGTPYAQLDCDPFAPGYTPPGGESWEDLHARTDAVWERVVRRARETTGHLVVVTHGLVCHSLVTRRLELGEGVRAPVGFANTALTWIEPEPPWRVALANCVAHLEDASVAREAGATPRA
jgi:broad specificity phosphatase PhoE